MSKGAAHSRTRLRKRSRARLSPPQGLARSVALFAGSVVLLRNFGALMAV